MIDMSLDSPIIRALGPATVRRLGAPGFRGVVSDGLTGILTYIEELAAWHA